MSIIIKGLPVSNGIAIGKCFILNHGQPQIKKEYIDKKLANSEKIRFDTATKKTIKDFEKIKKNISPSVKNNVALFLDTHILLVKDEAFLDSVRHKIKDKHYSAEWALYEEYLAIKKSFIDIEDSYIRERINDVYHVVNKILENLVIKKPSNVKISKFFNKKIIVADDLTPSDVLLTHQSKGLGLISEYGGRSSHSSILTRSLEIPSIVGMKDAQSILKNDDLLILDGNKGIIVIDPDKKALSHYKTMQLDYLKKKKALSTVMRKNTITLDKKNIEVMVNLELPQELKIINEKNIDGIGLFRTEYLYTDRSDLPTEQEQFLAYKKIVQKMKKKAVVFRTLDVGSDKEIPENIKTGSVARNPALGLRGIRHSLNDESIFLHQIKAILRAGYYGNVKILLPMITTLSEIKAAVEIIDKAKIQLSKSKLNFNDQIDVGIMIEVPSSAVLAHKLAKYIDFFSIGTNDLVQYTLAIDRVDDQVNYLYNPMNSAVLTLIKMTIDAGLKNEIPVSLCGEMAGDPNYTKLLLGMGLKSFSMHPSALPEVKNIMLSTDVLKIKKLTSQIINCDTSSEKSKLLKRLNKTN